MTRHYSIEETPLEHIRNKEKMLTLFVVLLIWSAVAANPIFQVVTPSSAEQKATPGYLDDLNVDKYLVRYGYMANDIDERSDNYAELRTDAIKLFQRFFSLEVTGEVNEETREAMLKPRCGMKDIGIENPRNIKWNMSEITYNIVKYTGDIPQSSTREAIRSAFSEWAGPSKLTFTKIESGMAVIEISFVTGDHPPCLYPLDGPGKVVAHAFFPSTDSTSGDIHFDDDETYVYDQGSGNKVGSVALHEIGHSLGLTHDDTQGSIMVPSYTGQTTLGPNDIRRIKNLYS